MPRNTEGKMAWVVGNVNQKDLGKAVKCVKYLGEIPRFAPKDMWEIDKTIQWADGNEYHFCPDQNLQPWLDPSPEEQDETLSWKPVPDAVLPEGVTA